MENIPALVLKKMILYFEKDARRINHALKVYTLSKNIGELEGIEGNNLLILEIASILHDIGIKESEKKYNSSAGNYQEIEGPPVAMKLLKDLGIDKDILERACYLIGNHHSYQKIDDLAFQILVEADFLVNAYEDNMDKKAICIFKEKYIKTKSALNYVNSIY